MLSVRAARMLAAATLLAITGGFASAEEEKVLNVYNWSDYVAPDTLEEFTRRTGIKVNYDVYDSNEVLEAKLLVGKSGYDVVFPSAMPYLAREVKGGIYQKLDFSKLPNAKGVDPKVLAQLKPADPNNQYALPYLMAGTGIGYIKSKMPSDAPVGSLALLFDPKAVGSLKSCGIAVLDTPDEVLPAALSYLAGSRTAPAMPTSRPPARWSPRRGPPTAIFIRRATSTILPMARSASRSAMPATCFRRASVPPRQRTASTSAFFCRRKAPPSTST